MLLAVGLAERLRRRIPLRPLPEPAD